MKCLLSDIIVHNLKNIVENVINRKNILINHAMQKPFTFVKFVHTESYDCNKCHYLTIRIFDQKKKDLIYLSITKPQKKLNLKQYAFSYLNIFLNHNNFRLL